MIEMRPIELAYESDVYVFTPSRSTWILQVMLSIGERIEIRLKQVLVNGIPLPEDVAEGSDPVFVGANSTITFLLTGRAYGMDLYVKEDDT